jgi:hypothetical protein
MRVTQRMRGARVAEWAGSVEESDRRKQPARAEHVHSVEASAMPQARRSHATVRCKGRLYNSAFVWLRIADGHTKGREPETIDVR